MTDHEEHLRILCFGNSLTAGYWHYGLEDPHPYALTLKEQLLSSELFPTTTKISIDVDGLPGDLAVSPPGRFLERMRAGCSKTTYDWVIVLGGTNDLGYGTFPASQIYAALQEAWTTALESGDKKTQVLALTIPECAVVSERLDRRRDELNKMILAHRGERFHTFDLHSALPYHSMPENQREKIWDDGLHLTDEGYDLMGKLIAGRLIELLGKEKSPSEAEAGSKSEIEVETKTETAGRDGSGHKN
ncbi:hypothetical protein VTN77DRAFT_2217 [Rasamsonia byssochlamydoides]|uniref:uncharacterized protein n=1 Tax=Rasamsonia byssochlamydoides TaxID=89139 RepID=UPI003743197E